MPETRRNSVSILVFSPIARDARVLRQVKNLSRHYSVDVIAYGELPPDFNHVARMLPVKLARGSVARRALTLALLPLGRAAPGWAYDKWYWSRSEVCSAYDNLLASHANIIHANDILALPVAVRAAQQTGASVVLDLHEFARLELENMYWRLLYCHLVEYLMRKYSPQAASYITVNTTIAERYKREYGFCPQVILNAPEYGSGIRFHPVNPEHIHLVHHGSAIRARRLDLMIETVSHADPRFHLHFMLVGDQDYIARLRARAEQVAPRRVSFHSPVSPDRVVHEIAQYDVGFYLLPPASYNDTVALPNKFFDFINAGLAACTGPSQEMVRLSHEYGFGTATSSFDPEEAAALLDRLTPAEIDHMKQQALAARATLNAEVEMGKLLKLYDGLFAGMS